MSWRAELPSEGLEKIIWEQPCDVQRKKRQIPVPGFAAPHPMQQHRLRETSQEAAGWRTWEAWWVETLEQFRSKVSRLAGEQGCRVWAEGRGAPARPYLCRNCSDLVPGDKNSNQAPCTLQERGNKHNFWVLKALDLSVIERFFLPDYSFEPLCLGYKTTVQSVLYHWRSCSFSLPHNQLLFSTPSQLFYF